MEDNGHYLYFSMNYAIVRLTSVLKRPFCLPPDCVAKRKEDKCFSDKAVSRKERKIAFSQPHTRFKCKSQTMRLQQKAGTRKGEVLFFFKTRLILPPHSLFFPLKSDCI